MSLDIFSVSHWAYASGVEVSLSLGVGIGTCAIRYSRICDVMFETLAPFMEEALTGNLPALAFPKKNSIPSLTVTLPSLPPPLPASASCILVNPTLRASFIVRSKYSVN